MTFIGNGKLSEKLKRLMNDQHCGLKPNFTCGSCGFWDGQKERDIKICVSHIYKKKYTHYRHMGNLEHRFMFWR